MKFSPDGTRFMYAGRLRQEYVVMVDGKEMGGRASWRAALPQASTQSGSAAQQAAAQTTYKVTGVEPTGYGCMDDGQRRGGFDQSIDIRGTNENPKLCFRDRGAGSIVSCRCSSPPNNQSRQRTWHRCRSLCSATNRRRCLISSERICDSIGNRKSTGWEPFDSVQGELWRLYEKDGNVSGTTWNDRQGVASGGVGVRMQERLANLQTGSLRNAALLGR